MTNDAQFWERARQARSKAAERYLNDPDVTLIDIGYVKDPNGTEEIGVRIHVRTRWMEADAAERTPFPEQIDGIPVAIIRGDYHLD